MATAFLQLQSNTRFDMKSFVLFSATHSKSKLKMSYFCADGSTGNPPRFLISLMFQVYYYFGH